MGWTVIQPQVVPHLISPHMLRPTQTLSFNSWIDSLDRYKIYVIIYCPLDHLRPHMSALSITL